MRVSRVSLLQFLFCSDRGRRRPPPVQRAHAAQRGGRLLTAAAPSSLLAAGEWPKRFDPNCRAPCTRAISATTRCTPPWGGSTHQRGALHHAANPVVIRSAGIPSRKRTNRTFAPHERQEWREGRRVLSGALRPLGLQLGLAGPDRAGHQGPAARPGLRRGPLPDGRLGRRPAPGAPAQRRTRAHTHTRLH